MVGHHYLKVFSNVDCSTTPQGLGGKRAGNPTFGGKHRLRKALQGPLCPAPGMVRTRDLLAALGL